MEHDGFPITEQGTAALAQKYDYEIAFVDGWVGKILDALAAAKLDDKTMVVIMSDHGEAFGVHTFAGQKMFFHGQTLYEELLRVPVMIRVPGVAPRKVDGVTELVDLAPTILDTFGLPAPASFVGRSLRDAMRTGDLPPRPAHAELLPAPSWDHSAKAMISADGTRKVIYVLSENRFEYFDIAKDPEERNELGAKSPDAAADLKEALAEWMEVGLQE
jgi:arylsulfatase A-like enzyme